MSAAHSPRLTITQDHIFEGHGCQALVAPSHVVLSEPTLPESNTLTVYTLGTKTTVRLDRHDVLRKLQHATGVDVAPALLGMYVPRADTNTVAWPSQSDAEPHVSTAHVALLSSPSPSQTACEDSACRRTTTTTTNNNTSCRLQFARDQCYRAGYDNMAQACALLDAECVSLRRWLGLSPSCSEARRMTPSLYHDNDDANDPCRQDMLLQSRHALRELVSRAQAAEAELTRWHLTRDALRSCLPSTITHAHSDVALDRALRQVEQIVVRVLPEMRRAQRTLEELLPRYHILAPAIEAATRRQQAWRDISALVNCPVRQSLRRLSAMVCEFAQDVSHSELQLRANAAALRARLDSVIDASSSSRL